VTGKKLGVIYQQLKQSFKQAGLHQSGLEAHLLLEWAAGLTYKDVISDPDKIVEEVICTQLGEGLERRLNGESIHRIRGWREFYGLEFHLSPETLEPRPDSEALIDLVLPVLQKCQGKIQLLDMGTGSGALSVALLVHQPQSYATGVDIAAGALKMATYNAKLNGVGERFTPCLSDGFAQVTGKYDLIISNPPYIVRAEIAGLDRTVRDFDPLIALDGGEDGLDFYRQLALSSRQFLEDCGKIAVEIGQGQEDQVTILFAEQDFRLVDKKDDLSGTCRALLFEDRL